jgi:hypothetical protein
MIKIDVSKGDEIRTGKFRNKKTIVKSITYDEFGLPLINNKKVVNFKLPKAKKNESNLNLVDIIQELTTSKYWITDNGKDIKVAPDWVLPRYGVWIKDVRGKATAIDVDEDVNKLLKKYNLNKNDIVKL